MPGGVVVADAPSPTSRGVGPTGGGAAALPRPYARTRTCVTSHRRREEGSQPHAGGNYGRGKTLVRKFLMFCVRSNRSLPTVYVFFFVEWILVGNWKCFRRYLFSREIIGGMSR